MKTEKGGKRGDKYVTETVDIIKYENMKGALLLLKLHLKSDVSILLHLRHSHHTALTMVLLYLQNAIRSLLCASLHSLIRHSFEYSM